MSDDNYRKQASPKATRIGLGIAGSDASFDRRPDEAPAARSNRRGAPARTMIGVPVGAPAAEPAEDDTHYMDPPSETYGFEPPGVARRPDTQRRTDTMRPEDEAGLLGATLRSHDAPAAVGVRRSQAGGPGGPDGSDGPGHTARTGQLGYPTDAAHPGLLHTPLNHTLGQQDVHLPPGAPRTQLSSSRAPEAWRDDVRRMVERAPTRGPLPGAPNKPSLHLKLDSDNLEEPYYAPKSPLPKVLAWLTMVVLVGGGGTYFYANTHGGIDAVLERLNGTEPKAPETQAPEVQPSAPTNTTNASSEPVQPQQQAVATPTGPTKASLQATQSPTTHNPTTQSPTTQSPTTQSPTTQSPTSEAATPGGATKALKLADPEPPHERTAHEATKHAQSATPSKPHRPTNTHKTKKRAVVRRHVPVVKVHPIDSAAAPNVALPPPEPTDTPYVPALSAPPAPDDLH